MDYICIYIYIYVCVCGGGVYVCMYVYVCVCVCVCVCVYVCVCVCVSYSNSSGYNGLELSRLRHVWSSLAGKGLGGGKDDEPIDSCSIVTMRQNRVDIAKILLPFQQKKITIPAV